MTALLGTPTATAQRSGSWRTAREGMRGRNQTNDRGESKLSVAQAGLPPGLTVGALLAAAALAVVAQLVCHRCGVCLCGMGAHAAQDR